MSRRNIAPYVKRPDLYDLCMGLILSVSKSTIAKTLLDDVVSRSEKDSRLLSRSIEIPKLPHVPKTSYRCNFYPVSIEK